MKGLTRELIYEVVRQYMPQDVNVVMVTHTYFMAQAKRSPWIQTQVRLGIYNAENIDEEFLSPMCAYVPQRTLDVDYELIINHMEDVDTIYAIGYVAEMALHERHHFEEHHEETNDPIAQSKREHDCNEQVVENHPIVHYLSEAASKDSATISRVIARMESLSP